MVRKLNPKTISSNYKKYLINRDGNGCKLCGHQKDLQIHHLQMRFLGGTNEEHNLITLCFYCHNFLHFNPVLRFRGSKFALNHSESTKQGLLKAKENGKILGRQKGWSKNNELYPQNNTQDTPQPLESKHNSSYTDKDKEES